MPRDRYADSNDDFYYDEYTDESRSMVSYGESGRELAIADDEEEESLGPLIIPGAAIPPRWAPVTKKKPVSTHMLLIIVSACVVLGTLFSVTPIGNSSDGGIPSNLASTFNALANVMVIKKQDDWVYYTIQSTDLSYDDIAARKGILLGGIYKINSFTADAEAHVGDIIKLPTDPTYGDGYKVPLPPGVRSSAKSVLGVNAAPSTETWLFNALAGRSNNDPTHCAAEASTYNDGSILAFNLGNPQKDGGNHWVRGFTAYHSGVDMSTSTLGTPLYAAQDGEVIFEGVDQGGGGNSIKINHCGGISTSYSHLQEFKVHYGDKVSKGDLIGLQGSTGKSSGPHLHFMLWWWNLPIDPLCGYSNLVGGYGVNSYHYNGCPPNVQSMSWG
jgi:murein DD-endopeptidase MepM/ murein hydrolase activator NlpD